MFRIDAFHTHRNDFIFQFYLAAIKRNFVIERLLVIEILQARVLLEPCEHSVYAFATTGNGTIDTFMCEQDGALDAVCLHYRKQWRLQRFEIIKRNEMIERTYNYAR